MHNYMLIAELHLPFGQKRKKSGEKDENIFSARYIFNLGTKVSCFCSTFFSSLIFILQ